MSECIDCGDEDIERGARRCASCAYQRVSWAYEADELARDNAMRREEDEDVS